MIEINSDGGHIGPIYWRNKSQELNWSIKLNDEGYLWNHKFYIWGSVGLNSQAFTRIRLVDILITEVSCQGDQLVLDGIPKVFLNMIKTTVPHAMFQVQKEIIHDNQVQYLNTCLNK